MHIEIKRVMGRIYNWYQFYMAIVSYWHKIISRRNKLRVQALFCLANVAEFVQIKATVWCRGNISRRKNSICNISRKKWYCICRQNMYSCKHFRSQSGGSKIPKNTVLIWMKRRRQRYMSMMNGPVACFIMRFSLPITKTIVWMLPIY